MPDIVLSTLYESAQVFSSSQLPYELRYKLFLTFKGTIIILLIQMRNSGTERLGHLPIVTQELVVDPGFSLRMSDSRALLVYHITIITLLHVYTALYSSLPKVHIHDPVR